MYSRHWTSATCVSCPISGLLSTAGGLRGRLRRIYGVQAGQAAADECTGLPRGSSLTPALCIASRPGPGGAPRDHTGFCFTRPPGAMKTCHVELVSLHEVSFCWPPAVDGYKSLYTKVCVPGRWLAICSARDASRSLWAAGEPGQAGDFISADERISAKRPPHSRREAQGDFNGTSAHSSVTPSRIRGTAASHQHIASRAADGMKV